MSRKKAVICAIVTKICRATILFACGYGLVLSTPAMAEPNPRVLVHEMGRSSTAVALVDREIRSMLEVERQPALMEAYGRYLFAGLLVLFGQLFLILNLLNKHAKEKIVRRHLRESEAQLREAQSIAQCGSWIWDVRYGKAHWSEEMYRIMGFVPGSIAPLGRLIHSGDDGQYAAKMREVSDAGKPYSAEYRIIRPNGEERIVLESGQPRYDSRRQLPTVVGTLLDITDQRRSERVLRESEERFRTMADGAPIMMWMSGPDKLCTDFNKGWLRFTGRSIEQELGDGWAFGVHADDVQRCMKTYIDAFDRRETFTMEYRLRRYDGVYHWISDSGSPRFLADGTFAGYIGCCIDIHDRKATELARADLARRMMSAQEAERRRIARELHDGIGQEIALLSIQMQRTLAPVSAEFGSKYPGVQQLNGKLSSIGVHVSRLSHQLHSSELEYLGLTVAITKLCREFSEEYPIKITCACTHIPGVLNNDIALNLLRIIQESLHNVAKHSKASTVSVEVNGEGDCLHLTIHDNGVGFDIRESETSLGLGLVSMRERTNMVGGEFRIDSSPGAGTTIRVLVPLANSYPIETTEKSST